MPTKLVFCLLLTVGGLVWTEHHAHAIHSMNSKNRSDMQQSHALVASGADTGIASDTDKDKVKPSPAIKWQPGRRRPTRASKPMATYADQRQLDKRTSAQ
jgi:hypothetical protein